LLGFLRISFHFLPQAFIQPFEPLDFFACRFMLLLSLVGQLSALSRSVLQVIVELIPLVLRVI
jgi:hypothetical protein